LHIRVERRIDIHLALLKRRCCKNIVALKLRLEELGGPVAKILLCGLLFWDVQPMLCRYRGCQLWNAITTLKREGRCPAELVHRQKKYLNNVIEADHGKLKRLIYPTLGF